MKRIVFILMILGFCDQIQAQTTAAPFTLRAYQTSEEINIDGRLDEPAWAGAESADGFYQREPFEGTAPSERTEARVLYDSKYIYFGIRAYDSTPDLINSRDLNRDSSFDNDDKVDILIDTYNDRRNAFLFTVNPLGTQRDGLVTDDGRNINTSWDALWFSEGRRDAEGYTLEIAIPLTTLRYAEGAGVWGFNIARTIRRKNEEAILASWKRTLGLLRVSQAGQLTGLEGLKRPRLLEFKPYVTGGWRQNVQSAGLAAPDTGLNATFGIEVARIGITPSLTAELTVNPDFGQAEVDSQVINFSRFSIFFPERREFFLENAGFFFFGRAGVNQLFFTRRIGLTPDGRPLPIDYGAKITGKAGRYNIGLLQVQTRASSTLPRQHYTVARVRRDILKSSSIGAIFVNREGGLRSVYNRGYGVDAQLDLNRFWRVSGFLAATSTPGVKSDSFTGRVNSDYRDNNLSLTTVYEEIGRNYNPEIGFTARTDVRQFFGLAAYRVRPKALKRVRELEVGGILEYYQTRSSGQLSTRTANSFLSVDFNDSSSFYLQPYNRVTDVLTRPFQLRPGFEIPVGVYGFNRPRVEYRSNQSRRFTFSTSYEWGGFYTGHRTEAGAGFTYRPNEKVAFSMEERYNIVKLPQGDFATNLYSLRSTINLSRRLLTSTFLQVNSAARLTSLNFRLRYIYRPNSDFYVIYNQNTGQGLERASYQLQLKATLYLRR